MPRTKKNKKTYIDHTTVFGTARFPRLNEPDTKFDTDGKFRVEVVFDEGEDPELVSKIDRLITEAKAMAAEEHPERTEITQDAGCLRELEDKDGNRVEGKVFLRASTKATKEVAGKKVPKTVPIFDGRNQPVTDIVGGGSVLRANVTLAPYVRVSSENRKRALIGVTAYLNGVQVTELRAPGGDPNSMGFGVVDTDDQDSFEAAGDGADY